MDVQATRVNCIVAPPHEERKEKSKADFAAAQFMLPDSGSMVPPPAYFLSAEVIKRG